jgi:hypothetical protein
MPIKLHNEKNRIDNIFFVIFREKLEWARVHSTLHWGRQPISKWLANHCNQSHLCVIRRMELLPFYVLFIALFIIIMQGYFPNEYKTYNSFHCSEWAFITMLFSLTKYFTGKFIQLFYCLSIAGRCMCICIYRPMKWNRKDNFKDKISVFAKWYIVVHVTSHFVSINKLNWWTLYSYSRV